MKYDHGKPSVSLNLYKSFPAGIDSRFILCGKIHDRTEKELKELYTNKIICSGLTVGDRKNKG